MLSYYFSSETSVSNITLEIMLSYWTSSPAWWGRRHKTTSHQFGDSHHIQHCGPPAGSDKHMRTATFWWPQSASRCNRTPTWTHCWCLIAFDAGPLVVNSWLECLRAGVIHKVKSPVAVVVLLAALMEFFVSNQNAWLEQQPSSHHGVHTANMEGPTYCVRVSNAIQCSVYFIMVKNKIK